MQKTILTRSEFLNKFKTNEFQFIPYEGIFGNTISFPSCLLNLNHEGSTCVEISSFIDEIKLTHYFVCNCPSIVTEGTVDYRLERLVFSSPSSWSEKPRVYFHDLPQEIVLYSSCSLEDWKEAIELGYNMVKELHDGDSAIFTYDDVFKNVIGRYNDMGSNISNGVNARLKNKSIYLLGMNRGSHVSVFCECEKCS